MDESYDLLSAAEQKLFQKDYRCSWAGCNLEGVEACATPNVISIWICSTVWHPW